MTRNIADINLDAEHPVEREHRYRNAPHMLGDLGGIEVWRRGPRITFVRKALSRQQEEVDITISLEQAARLVRWLTPEPVEPDEVPL